MPKDKIEIYKKLNVEGSHLIKKKKIKWEHNNLIEKKIKKKQNSISSK